jgi:glycine/sarcosine N-methyltransferase
MSDSIERFYDQLAEHYHLIFSDWQLSIFRQGEALDRLIRMQRGAPPFALLDCSAGIGTQALGLAQRGYQIHATDISPAAIARLQREARKLDVGLTTGIVDMRQLEELVPGVFDIVISCDNSLPHLLSEQDLALAAHSIYAKVREGGMFLASIREYDELLRERPIATTPTPIYTREGRRIYFQIWDWDPDGRCYTLSLFIVREQDGAWATECYTTRYRALKRDELGAILHEAGFVDVAWHMPAETGYFQPIVTATKR